MLCCCSLIYGLTVFGWPLVSNYSRGSHTQKGFVPKIMFLKGLRGPHFKMFQTSLRVDLWCAEQTIYISNFPINFGHCHAWRRLGWHQPSQAFFWYDPDYSAVLCCLCRLYFIVGVVPNEGLAWLVPAKPSVGMTMTKILRPIFMCRFMHFAFQCW